ncbi:MAG: hypothetical protein L6R42_002629 [Xanthoria sp. 1 TBL-2021]|nr:MAG: hypothetical protein L6R42_002629 [Xanthoria sp. 1 TBL-2021]
MLSDKKPRTLYDKIFDDHVVAEKDNGTVLLYIGLETRGLPVRRPDLTLATSDHNVPTTTRPPGVKALTYLKSTASRIQVQQLERNVQAHQIPYLGLKSTRQGIVHVIGPELGFTLPGTTIVCGDSHTSTHGAFGALAFGIGTSEVEHVLASQTVVATRSRNMKIEVEGELAQGVGSKDLMFYIISIIAGGTGMVIEFAGSVIRQLTMESRMALCNMSIEAGARAGLIAPDAVTLNYVRGKSLAPKSGHWLEANRYWVNLYSDVDACFDKIVAINASQVVPTVTWWTSPEQVAPITGVVPSPEDFEDPVKRESCSQALKYMDLQPGVQITTIPVDKVFIGSCTNARLEDFRAAARILKGKRISPGLKVALVVPGSGAVKRAAEKEGLDVVFKNSGFQWREAGCSLCVGLNEDALLPFERCASTSNRNFESRQGTLGRTHLVSPVVAAATAIKGTLSGPSLDEVPNLAGYDDLGYSSGSEESQDRSESENSEDEIVDSHAPPKRVLPVASVRYTALVKGTIAVIERSNIDTDCNFPKQFCTTTERTGLGHALFHNLRYNPDATGPNFGCGSSREHAVWALQDFGFQCILAPSFADIFYNNAFKNGLLLIKIDMDAMTRILAECRAHKRIHINLAEQTGLDQNNVEFARFDIEERRKMELLNGMDEIDTTLRFSAAIRAFEESRRLVRPWIEDAVQGWRSKQSRNATLGREINSGGLLEPVVLDW